MAYNKTTWENAPSTNSPISANNLNKIENGIYNNSLKADQIGDLSQLETSEKSTIVGSINTLVSTTLYTNNDGATGNITLSDSSANYSRIDVVVKTNNTNIYTTNTLYDADGKTYEIKTGNGETGLTDYYEFVSCTLSFSGTSVTRANNRQVLLRNGSTPTINTTMDYYNLKITKVIGYK